MTHAVETGSFDGWKTTRSGFQLTTLDGKEYATYFDLRTRLPGDPGDLFRSRGKYVVAFQVTGPHSKPGDTVQYPGLRVARLLKVVGLASEGGEALGGASTFRVTGAEYVREGTAKVYVDAGRDGELQITVYPAPLPMRVHARSSDVQWLEADLTDAQRAKVRAAAASTQTKARAGLGAGGEGVWNESRESEWWKLTEMRVRKALWETSKLPWDPPMSVMRESYPGGPKEPWGLDQEVFSTMSPRGVRAGWLDPSPWKVYVIMECCLGPLRSKGFTADDARGFAFMGRAVKHLLKSEPLAFTDAGWESYNAAVAYVWVKPRLVG